MKRLLLAIQFLTIIPVRVKGDVSEKDMAGSTVFFPLAGACQGIMLVLVAAGLHAFLPTQVVCGFVLLAHILSNGGFDLDGLADTADAMAVKSSGDKDLDIEKRLSVMKDSSTGASGATAIVMSLLLKFLLISGLYQAAPLPVFLSAVFLMTVFSKWLTVPAMLHAGSARRDGLGRIFIDHITLSHLAGSTLTLILLSLVPFLPLFKSMTPASYFAGILALILSQYIFCIAAVGFFRRRFGGSTGDTFGAMSEISEIIFLTMVLIWLQHSTS
ncbi:MAG: adenosylcobinamide-GDP ribazoletransferase [Nitrospirae bacterium]|nr:adenosylcobinamide-GDP ribazoletransferase [Nitrospirota bacterium]